MASRFDNDARNAVALNLADQGGDEAARLQLHKRKRAIIRTRIIILAGCVIAGAAVALVLAGRSGHVPSRSTAIAPWRTTVGLIMIGAALLIEVVVIVSRIRSGEFTASWRSPSLMLTWRQRRQLAQQIRGHQPVDPPLLPVTRQLATRMARQRSLVGLWMALPLILIGQALMSNSAYRWWFAMALLLPYLWLIVQTLRDSSRADRFLAYYGGAAPSDTAF